MKAPDELLAIVDDKDIDELTPQPRSVVRAQRLWCRSVHIWVINSEGYILCHQRSFNKDSNPGRWTPHFGGHNRPGESYATAAVRELREEIGLQITEKHLHYYKTHRWQKGHKFQTVYLVQWNGNAFDIEVNRHEIQQLRWVKPAEVAVSVSSAQWAHFGYEEELLASFLGNDGTDCSPWR